MAGKVKEVKELFLLNPHNRKLAVGRGGTGGRQPARLIRRPGPWESQAGLHALRQQQLQPRQREHLRRSRLWCPDLLRLLHACSLHGTSLFSSSVWPLCMHASLIESGERGAGCGERKGAQ